MAKPVAVVLSGAGVFDGSELHEAVIANLALHREGFQTEFLAPDIDQAHVFDHLAGSPAEGESRNVLREAARIARGKIQDIATASAGDYVGIVFPGGFGAAKNLCDFAFKGAEMSVNPAVAQCISAFQAAGKPMVFLCIAPVLAAKAIGGGVELTIGNNAEVAAAINSVGGKHVDKPVNECHVDMAKKVVTAPAYMYETDIVEIAEGIEKAIAEFARLAR